MKQNFLVGALLLGAIITGLAFILWLRTPLGEHQVDRGTVYYFSDGVVAIDTSLPTDEFYIYANHPGDKMIEKVEIIENGLHITGPGIAPGAEEAIGAELSVGYAKPPKSGKVRVWENHGDWSDGRYRNISTDAIRKFVERREWNASVRELF